MSVESFYLKYFASSEKTKSEYFVLDLLDTSQVFLKKLKVFSYLKVFPIQLDGNLTIPR